MTQKHNKIKLTLDDLGNFLSKFAERSDQVYWLSSPDFKKIQYISPSYEKIWGRSREELYANPEIWITFLHPEDAVKQHPIEEMAEKVKRLGEAARFSENYRIVRPDGEIRWIIDNGFPIYDDKGICYGITGVAIDVTNERTFVQKMDEAKDRINESEIAKTKAEAATIVSKAKADAEEEMRKTVMVLVGDIVHDLRTPIATIRTITSILSTIHPPLLEMIEELKELGGKKQDLLSKKKWQYMLDNSPVLSLQSAVTMMDNFINSSLSELSNAQKALKSDLTRDALTLCSSRRIIENTLNSYPEIISKIKLHQNNSYDFYLLGNSILIMKILFNLIKNAVEQISLKRDGKGDITISTQETTDNNLIIIKDTGGGAPPEIIEKFFEGFYTTKINGTGIGLAFCKRTMLSFGGDLTYVSNYGESMEFILSFPKVKN